MDVVCDENVVSMLMIFVRRCTPEVIETVLWWAVILVLGRHCSMVRCVGLGRQAVSVVVWQDEIRVDGADHLVAFCELLRKLLCIGDACFMDSNRLLVVWPHIDVFYTFTRWTRTVWYVMWHTARWKSFNIKRLFHRNWTWPTFESCTCHLCVVDPRGWRSTMWFAVCTVMCWCVDGTMLWSFWVDTYADSACDCAAGLGAIRLQTGGVCRGLLDPKTLVRFVIWNNWYIGTSWNNLFWSMQWLRYLLLL